MKNKRAFNALIGEVWALSPEKMEQVQAFAQTLLEGRTTSVEAFESYAGSGADEKPYSIISGVAVIPVSGVIARRMNLFSNFSGGCSTELVGRQVSAAAADSDVRAIVLDINSPGGGCFGLTELAGIIRSVRDSGKPVVSHTAELMCSAAYWIGSAATEMICTVDAEVGSIGVAAMHVDKSEQDKKEGVVRTVLSAGHYKRLTSDEKPLSDEGKAYLQEKIDDYYNLFVNAVAENRGLSAEDVRKNLADGSTHIGQSAKDKGFVDAIGNLEFAVKRALQLSINETEDNTMPAGTNSANLGAMGGGSGLNLSAITAAEISAANPALAAELAAQGVNSERLRVLELFEAGADHKLTLGAVRDGTDPKDFFKAVLAAQHTERMAAVDDFEKSLSESAGQDGKQSKSNGDSSIAEFEALVNKAMEDKKCSRGQALAAVASANPQVHEAWLEAVNKGAK